MLNMKTISQKTGQFIDEDANEPGFLVNMDDPKSAEFIAKLRGENFTEAKVKEEAPPESKTLTAAKKRAVTMAAKKAVEAKKGNQ